jgi:hypothetical protein
MVKAAFGVVIATVMGVFAAGCSPTISDSSICRSMGYFVSQAECTGTTQSSCEMTQLSSQSTGKTVICWKVGSGNTVFSSPTPVTSPTPFTSPTPVQSSTPRPDPFQSSTPIPSPTPNLYGAIHSDTQCVSAGGVVRWLNDVTRYCQFMGASCPSGWSAYKSNGIAWTETSLATALDHITCTGGRMTVTTGFHAFAPLAVESKDYCSWRNCRTCKQWSTVYANVTKVGCY